MELLLLVGVLVVAAVVVVVRARADAQTSIEASSEALHAYVDPIDEPAGNEEALFDAAKEMPVDEIDVEPEAGGPDAAEDEGHGRFEATPAAGDSEIAYSELVAKAPDYVPEGLLDDTDASDVIREDELGQDVESTDAEAADQDPPPLAKRTPKEQATNARGGGELRMANTNQRPSGQTARTPEEVRSLLSNYRGGLRKGRGDS